MIAAPIQARVLSPFSSPRGELESSNASGTLEPINPRLRELKRPTMVDMHAMNTKSPLRLTNPAQTYDPNNPVILAVCTTFMVDSASFTAIFYQIQPATASSHSSFRERGSHFACLIQKASRANDGLFHREQEHSCPYFNQAHRITIGAVDPATKRTTTPPPSMRVPESKFAVAPEQPCQHGLESHQEQN